MTASGSFGIIGVFWIIFGAVVTVRCSLPDGYLLNNATGHAYKLMYRSQPWEVARNKCVTEEAKLAVPKSEEEFTFIQKIIRGMHYPSIIGSKYNLLVWIGVNNLDDYKVWKNVDGENIDDTGYHKWAGLGNGATYSSNPKEPHCGGMDAVNEGLRDFWCDHYQPYICEIRPNNV